MLVDRCCRGGGWNYGNSNMLGKELRPYVPTTAVALLALQDRGSEPVVTEGLAFLERHATSERSAIGAGARHRARSARTGATRRPSTPRSASNLPIPWLSATMRPPPWRSQLQLMNAR